MLDNNAKPEEIAELTAELIDWRITEYLNRKPATVDWGSSSIPKNPEQIWREYMREEIPVFCGAEFNVGKWQQGYVKEGNQIFLLVTMNKSGLGKDHQYEDRFISNTEFHWVSQNRTKQNSSTGKALSQHNALSNDIHLFVRKNKLRGKTASPFLYCGQVDFESWEGDAPIHIVWKPRNSMPEAMYDQF